MRIFSETFNTFRLKQQKRVNEIYNDLRFNDKMASLVRMNNIPKVFIGQHKKDNLGAYHHSTKTITLSPKLLTIKQEVIDEVIKHELAHYFQFIKYARFEKQMMSHGKEFVDICEMMGIGHEAKMNLKQNNKDAKASLKEEGLLAKVEKLFKLGESHNESEANAAITKANELIQKYNLQYVGLDTDEIYQETVYTGKAKTSIVSAVSRLVVDLFEVHAVWGRLGDPISLELNGAKEKVEVASYVFDFVLREVDRFYQAARKEHGLKGRTAKINYITNLLREYVNNAKSHNEVEATPEQASHEKAVTLFKQEEYKKVNEVIYQGRLRQTYSSGYRGCSKSAAAGRSDSSKFSINKGVKSSGGQKLLG